MSGWVKIAAEWLDREEVEKMSADDIVFYLSALSYSCRLTLDGDVPARAVRHLRPVDDVDATIDRLVAKGWWTPLDAGKRWHMPAWNDFLLSKEEVDRRREQTRVTSDRYRRHIAGDHSICRPQSCPVARADKSRDASPKQSVMNPGPVRNGPDRPDPRREGGEGGASRAGTGRQAPNIGERCTCPPGTPQAEGDCVRCGGRVYVDELDKATLPV